jgi:glutaryl-CoA dehydrogenase
MKTTTAEPAAGAFPSVDEQERLYSAADWYDAESLLTAGERRVLARLREFLDRQAKPLLAEYWERGEFPEQLAQPLIDLDLMEPGGLAGHGMEKGPARGIYQGFRIFELARTDASLATWYTAQAGLFRTAIRVGASEEQQREWMPKVIDFSLKGVFSLTEPESGSDIAGGLSTTARFEADADGGTWIIDGAKRWIGGASTADVLAVFARDVADGQVKAFLVDRLAEGVSLEKIHGKTSLRMMQNAHIKLEGVRVPEAMRLHNVNSFRDVAAMLRAMRSDVAWIATGIQAGAFEAALTYVNERQQFGRIVGLLPAGAGETGPHAREHHGQPVPGGPADRTTGQGHLPGPGLGPGQDADVPVYARNRRPGAGSCRRQRHHARRRRRPLPRRR